MSDESLSPEPARTARTGSTVIVGVLAFLAGMACLAVFAHFWGGWPSSPAPGPEPMAAIQPEASAVPTVPPGTDLSALYAREEALAQRLQTLEARADVIDNSSRNAASNATRAEALMVMLSTRRALSRGQPLGYLEGQIQERFGESQPQAVAAVLAIGRAPVTLEDLRLALDTIAPKLASGNPEESWWRVFRRRLGDLVVLRRDSTPSPRPSDRLERARHALDTGQVEVALAEVERLPGVRNGESWMAAARRYAQAQRALSTLEEAAVTAPAPKPGPAA